MSNKRLLILAILGDPTLPPGISYTGGMNQTVKHVLLLVSRLQLPCTVITGTCEYIEAEKEMLSPTVELFRIQLTRDEIINQDLLFCATNRILDQIQEILSERQFAIIHSFYWFSGYIANRISSKYYIPVIHTVISVAYEKIITGVTPNSKYQVECENATFLTADYILAITEQESDKLASYYNVPPEKILVTGRSVADIFYAPSRNNNGLPDGIKTPLSRTGILSECDASWWNNGAFLYIGRILEIKGVDYIIRAWVALAKKEPDRVPPL